MKSELPRGFEVEYMGYVLCDGDAAKEKALSEMTYGEVMRWFCFKRYENYITQKSMKRG